uniref:Uncharacterized protein n=1 Tax=Panagrolaimus sp. PS1159 TaxID=55785 RepID=A0AC35GWT6_9BILA
MGIRDKSGSRSGSIHTSEHSLPEKLSQALKALRPGVLSQSSSGSSPFASKSGVVDADDVIYYTGANNKMPFQEQNSYEKKSSVKGRIFGNTRKSKSVFTKHSSPSRNGNDIAQFNLKSLDQIRHLYKSVPNVSSFDDGDEATPSTSRRCVDDAYAEIPSHVRPSTSRRCIDDAYAEIPSNNLSAMRSNSKYSRHSNSTKGLNADAFTATSSSMSSLGTSQSPTDSGYRSTPRHLFAAGIDSTKPPP